MPHDKMLTILLQAIPGGHLAHRETGNGSEPQRTVQEDRRERKKCAPGGRRERVGFPHQRGVAASLPPEQGPRRGIELVLYGIYTMIGVGVFLFLHLASGWTSSTVTFIVVVFFSIVVHHQQRGVYPCPLFFSIIAAWTLFCVPIGFLEVLFSLRLCMYFVLLPFGH